MKQGIYVNTRDMNNNRKDDMDEDTAKAELLLFFVECYEDADYPSTGTSFSELVLAENLESASAMIRERRGDDVNIHEGHLVDLDKISRMRKPRILS